MISMTLWQIIKDWTLRGCGNPARVERGNIQANVNDVVNNRNTKKSCKKSSKLRGKTSEQRQWSCHKSLRIALQGVVAN